MMETLEAVLLSVLTGEVITHTQTLTGVISMGGILVQQHLHQGTIFNPTPSVANSIGNTLV